MEPTLAPYAAHSSQTRGRRHRRTARRAALRIPARPRPHHPFHRLPPAGIQDPGVRQPRRRPVPHPADPQPRGGADRPHHRAHAGPERGPGRSHRAGARPRPHALRPRRAGCAERLHDASTAASSTTCSRCAWSTCWSSATPNSTASTSPSKRARASSSTARSSNAEKLGDVGERFLDRQQPSLEAQITNLADEIAYNNHDVDDGLRSGLITLEQLDEVRHLRAPPGRRCAASIRTLNGRRVIHETVRRMINTLIVDLVEHHAQQHRRTAAVTASTTCAPRRRWPPSARRCWTSTAN